jgi:hypothetical protein
MQKSVFVFKPLVDLQEDFNRKSDVSMKRKVDTFNPFTYLFTFGCTRG